MDQRVEDGSSLEAARPRVQSAKRTIDLLVAIAQSPNGLRAKELSVQLGVPRQVIYHLLHSMAPTGLLRRDHQERYSLGIAAAAISDGYLRQSSPEARRNRPQRSNPVETMNAAYATGWLDPRASFLSTARGRAAKAAEESLSSFWEFMN